MSYGVDRPVFVTPSGIDLDRFAGEPDPLHQAVLRRSLEIPEENLILVCVGRLAEEKNLDELLELRASLGEAPVTLLLVGDGPDRARLEGIAAGLGLSAPAVVFAGMVPPAQVPDWYQLGDLFVSASTSETQGLTYIEALAAGVPVLCRADPCLDGVVREGENGWQYHSADEFRSRLGWYLAHPDRWRAMADRARRSAEPFSLQNFSGQVETIYRRQIARRQGETRGVPA